MLIRNVKELEDVWCPGVRLVQLNGGKVLTNRGVIFDQGSQDPKKYCCCVGYQCGYWEWNVIGKDGFCSMGHRKPSDIIMKGDKSWGQMHR